LNIGSCGEDRYLVSPERRLRVLSLVDTLRPGGAERVAVTIASRVDRKRFEPVVCVSRGLACPPLADVLRSAEVPIVTLERQHRIALWDWRRLLDLLRGRQIDVVHAHMFGSNAWGTALGRAAGVPVVVAHEHSWSFERNRIRYVLDRELIARGADAFVAVSEQDRLRMVELERIPAEKIRVIRNGIPPLEPPRSDVRAELGLSTRTPVIGTLAVLRREKGLDVLVEATARLLPSIPQLRVVIAGVGPDEARLRDVIRAAGLERNVLLIGFRADVAAVLDALDVVVFSSDREGSPLAVIESMAAGKAIVATAVAGIAELLLHGQHALLVPPRDSDALAHAIACLLQDRALSAELGNRARERQQARFDVDSTVHAFEELYQQLFAASRRGRREATARAAFGLSESQLRKRSGEARRSSGQS
jgi:glycosyltransferase involved in cell wall biosynthesis